MNEAWLDVRLGATPVEGGVDFVAWAPRAREAVVVIAPDGEAREVPARSEAHGIVRARVDGVGPGTRYAWRLDGGALRPDPASRLQPDGVHGPSEVVSLEHAWTDHGWGGHALEELVFYELHVGAFSPEGTFDGVVDRLGQLVDLGITAVELMPIAAFPGTRNWGYDGVLPFAAQASHGGPAGLRRLVDACHARGLSLFLDVVHNHLGPEGNHLREWGPYFTDAYRTPWGEALNFSEAHCDAVRRHSVQSALAWAEECHVDGFRLDAIHAIVDPSARSFLQDLTAALDECSKRLGRPVHVIAESDANDRRVALERERDGIGCHGQWSDDFHHALHARLTGERAGYYQDFGAAAQVAKAFARSFVYTGEPSRYRNRRHGTPVDDLPPARFVVFAQNHDQVGNRADSARLAALVPDALRLLAGLVLTAPGLPLLFMGEEHGETAPFPYFVDHSDPGLLEAVADGRRAEFAAFDWQAEPPDPGAAETFELARPDWSLRETERGAGLLALHRELLRLRREHGALGALGAAADRGEVAAEARDDDLVVAWRRSGGREVLAAYNFGGTVRPASLADFAGVRPGAGALAWERLVDGDDAAWGGPGAACPARVVEGAALAIGARSFVLLDAPAEEEASR